MKINPIFSVLGLGVVGGVIGYNSGEPSNRFKNACIGAITGAVGGLAFGLWRRRFFTNLGRLPAIESPPVPTLPPDKISSHDIEMWGIPFRLERRRWYFATQEDAQFHARTNMISIMNLIAARDMKNVTSWYFDHHTEVWVEGLLPKRVPEPLQVISRTVVDYAAEARETSRLLESGLTSTGFDYKPDNLLIDGPDYMNPKFGILDSTFQQIRIAWSKADDTGLPYVYTELKYLQSMPAAERLVTAVARKVLMG